MSVRLVVGDDPILAAQAVSKLIDELVGDSDRALTLAHFYEDGFRLPEGGWSLSALADAAQTPPFLTDRRVVVGRHLARFSRAADYEPLLRLLGDKLPTTDLVLVWERGVEPAMDGRFPRVPPRLAAAVKAADGKVTNVSSPTRRQAGACCAPSWMTPACNSAGLRRPRWRS